MTGARFEMLVRMFGDEQTNEIFSERSLVESWLSVELALVTAQAQLGLLDADAAQAISEVLRIETIDLHALWAEARKVGYPILPLVRQIDARLPAGYRGRVHFGATTQDIMDSGLALQLVRAGRRQDELLGIFGDALAGLAEAHATTVIAARTHAQQAVPTVLGAKFAVYLAEVSRHRTRLRSNLRDIGVVSLFGAGGTSAAYGAQALLLRRAVADRLGLHSVDVPWHVARDGLATFAMGNAAMAATAARFAREVIDLSRTEIAEVAEAGGYLRGASSTMPQKSNPIDSESVIGLAASAGALSVAMLRAMEAGHERSAGEWQIEWQVLPQVACLCSSAVLTAGIVTENLQVFPGRMRENLNADGGLIMAEAYMMRLAPRIGREEAHELVYEAARQVRESNRPLLDIVRELVPDGTRHELPEVLVPESYLGDPQVTIDAALNGWHDASVGDRMMGSSGD